MIRSTSSLPPSLFSARRPVEREIARRLRPDLRRAGGERVDRRGDGRQRLVVDHDQIGGVARSRKRLGDHQRDRFADMDNAVAGQGRPVRHDQRPAIAAGLRARA